MPTPATTVLRRGVLRHCAVCGQGHLFRHWVRMLPACPQCGLRFARLPGHWLGSWFLNICLVQVVVVAILVIGVAATYPDVPMGIIGTVTGLAAVLVPFAFFPFSRTIWTAIDLVMRPVDFHDDVTPGYLLEDDIERLRTERDAA
jgi:uncharacterized protein (DUF983 family)